MKHYNPDVLNCLANLSNDEVFTPPALANQVLDMLPQELFCSPDTKFLDPVSKSGVFLREIVKRLDRGLQLIIPDRQQRIDHIMHHQVFGIATTELTSYISRRSLYCSREADSQYSVSHFDTAEGNIVFRNLRHTWQRGKCKYCGASQEVYDRSDADEHYAYQFIHTDNPQKLFPKNMKFDVIIGNPPYQLSDGGHGVSAKPLYHLFVEQAKKLNPRFLTMIIPARWYAGGKGLDEFRDSMLGDSRIRILVDYFDANDCFPGIDISGGVCYFLWDRDNKGLCKVVSKRKNTTNEMERELLENGAVSFIRFNPAISILRKTKKHNEKTFVYLVSSRKPFGLGTKPQLSSIQKDKYVYTYAYPNNAYVNNKLITMNYHWIDKHKIFISKAYGERGDFPYLVLGKPFYGAPNTCCTETYIVIGPLENQERCDNCMSYMRTRFFRFMVLLKKNTQDSPKGVYQFVPLQDFSHPWTDEMLYKKYGLTEDEIAFIESMIRPME